MINELFHTERSHVRNLKVHVFRRPLLECGLVPAEVVDQLFPNLQEVIVVQHGDEGAGEGRLPDRADGQPAG